VCVLSGESEDVAGDPRPPTKSGFRTWTPYQKKILEQCDMFLWKLHVLACS